MTHGRANILLRAAGAGCALIFMAMIGVELIPALRSRAAVKP